MKLSEIVQGQNDRVGALETDTLDDKLVTPQIAKIFEYLSISTRIKVTKADYYMCGKVLCDADQKTLNL